MYNTRIWFVCNVYLTILIIIIMESLALLASRLATSSNRAKAVVLAELYGRLNLCLVRANAVAILSRCFVPDQ